MIGGTLNAHSLAALRVGFRHRAKIAETSGICSSFSRIALPSFFSAAFRAAGSPAGQLDDPLPLARHRNPLIALGVVAKLVGRFGRRAVLVGHIFVKISPQEGVQRGKSSPPLSPLSNLRHAVSSATLRIRSQNIISVRPPRTLTPPARACTGREWTSPRFIVRPIASIAVIVQHQVRMPVLAAQPALNLVLRLRDRRAHHVLCRGAIRIGRCAGNVLLASQPPTEILFALPDMLAQDMAARLARPGSGRGPDPRVRRLSSWRACCRLARPASLELAPFGRASGWHEIKLAPLEQRQAPGSVRFRQIVVIRLSQISSPV